MKLDHQQLSDFRYKDTISIYPTGIRTLGGDNGDLYPVIVFSDHGVERKDIHDAS